MILFSSFFLFALCLHEMEQKYHEKNWFENKIYRVWFKIIIETFLFAGESQSSLQWPSSSTLTLPKLCLWFISQSVKFYFVFCNQKNKPQLSQFDRMSVYNKFFNWKQISHILQEFFTSWWTEVRFCKEWRVVNSHTFFQGLFLFRLRFKTENRLLLINLYQRRIQNLVKYIAQIFLGKRFTVFSFLFSQKSLS